MENISTGKHINLPVVSQDADLREVARVMLESKEGVVIVEKEDGAKGYIDFNVVLKWFLMGDEALKFKAKDFAILIEDKDKVEPTMSMEALVESVITHRDSRLFTNINGGVIGRLSLENLMEELAKSYSGEKEKEARLERLIGMMIDLFPFGVALVSVAGEIIRVNELAMEIISENPIDVEEIRKMINDNREKILTSKAGTYYRMSANILGETNNFLITFTDITAEYNMMQNLKSSQNEVETAFSIMLPDQRIEARLKSISEYMDEYDESTGMVKITGVIRNGGFRHVVNMLKLIADAFRQGLMELPGMDKNALVQAAILHDIGKVQPDLKIGDIVNPKEAFEKGYFHAFRSADLSKALYNIDDKMYYLIKYHHLENELPSDFPEVLLPMYRFFRLIDGLSAGITRRGSKVLMEINGTRIYVKEESSFPSYNQEIEMDIYTGSFNSRKL
ncbi:HD domain-containing protein [Calorimonas adulescens]|uniref:HD domain-containing protein n=1 Tax=Calorimonas adulescens TaxID=2606906 RepID=A0A5D8QAI1_9THEO|nr:HD domain-containing protein [Calorimonas adulescens]TZE81139.1 HD domain-containing protein [Calorimonas adulescens]